MNRKELAELVTNTVFFFDPYNGADKEDALSGTLELLKTKSGCFEVIEQLCEMLMEV